MRGHKCGCSPQHSPRDPNARIEVLARDFLDAEVAARFTDCDFLFLAADTMGARLLFNAIVHQYGIPGIQVGAKIPVAEDGTVGNVFCVSRMVTPELGCLWCNDSSNPARCIRVVRMAAKLASHTWSPPSWRPNAG